MISAPILLVAVAAVALAGYVAYSRWDDSTRAAERRWRANNRRAKTAGCPCGRLATDVRYEHRVTGSVPAETWTCAEHVGVSMWAGDGVTMTPSWPRRTPCGSCTGRCGRSTRNGETEPYEWHCPIRPGVPQ